jgi:hypothetical protein
MLKKILLFLLLIFVVVQFIHPEKNNAPGTQPNYIGNAYAIPGNVKIILEKACNDCHSNNTNYPWYTRLQPVDWWMNKHLKDGKKHLNFDEYTNQRLSSQYHKMEELAEMVKEDEMPLNSYTWVHKDAKLTQIEKNSLINWADDIRTQLEAKYPMDSLIRKKH